MPMNLLETRGIRKSFGGVHALAGVSIAVPEGAIVGIVGPNGSGKSTFVNILSGMEPADEGVIEIRGVRLAFRGAHEPARHGITRTFQEVRLFGQMTVLDNILVVLTGRGVFRALFSEHTRDHLARARDLLAAVGLWEKRDHAAENLSYGQRKLLEIARALAMGPRVILFDEPFAGLFPEMAKRVVGLIRDLRRRGLGVVLIEHNMELVRELCDRVVVFDAGKLLAEGKPKETLSKREVVEAYLGT